MRKSKLMKALLVFGMSVVTATSMVGIAACNPDSGNGDDNGNGNGHQHSYDGWLTSSTQHWHECLECSEEADRGNHVDVKNNKTDAAGADNYCDVCGYELAHTFADTWSKDATGHWHAATCEHTTEKGDFAAHVDADKNNVCDECEFVGAVADGYTALAEKAGATTIVADTFFAQDTKINTAFTSFGTKGMYARPEKDTATVDTNYIQVSGGSAVHVTNGAVNTGLVVDFGGALAGVVVEGYAEINPSAMGSKWSIIKFFNGENCDDANRVLALQTKDSSGTLGYTLTDKDNVINAQEAVAISAGAIAKVYYKFDLSTGHVTLKVNDKVIADVDAGIYSVTGYEIISSSSGARLVTMDNLITVATEVSLDAYKQGITAKLTAEKGKITAAGFNVDTGMQTADQALQTALSDASATTATLTDAYNTWFAALLSAYGDVVKNKINTDYPATDYDDAKNEDAAAYTAAVEKLGTDLQAAKTVEKVTAAYKAADTTIKALHNDVWWTLEDVVVTVVNGTTGANTLTVKTGDTVTEAQLKALVTPAAGYAISGFYTDVDCTGGNEVAFPLTVNANTKVYAKLVKQTVYNLSVADVPSSAIAADGSQVIGGAGGFFTALGNVKSESAKMNSGTYTKQVSLTKGKASATNNAIKFTVTGEATITVVAGAKSDKPTVKLAVLDASGAAVTPTDIKLNGTASTFENLPVATTDATAEIAVTYTFKLPAGTYCIGGSGGGAYIFALTVAV